MRAHSPPLARVLALAILLGLGAVIYVGVIEPLLGIYGSDRVLSAQLEAQLARFEPIARAQPQRRAELAALKQQQAVQDGFLQGTNETLVAAQLQNRIKSLVAAGDGELVSAEILAAQEDGNFRRIGVRAQLSITMAGALRVFHDLESASPLLFLDDVEMRGQPEVRRRIGVPQPPYATIDVRFDVYGYMHGKPRDDAAAASAAPAAARRGR